MVLLLARARAKQTKRGHRSRRTEPVVQDAMIVDSGEPASKFDSEAPAAAVAAGEQEEEKSLPKVCKNLFAPAAYRLIHICRIHSSTALKNS